MYLFCVNILSSALATTKFDHKFFSPYFFGVCFCQFLFVYILSLQIVVHLSLKKWFYHVSVCLCEYTYFAILYLFELFSLTNILDDPGLLWLKMVPFGINVVYINFISLQIPSNSQKHHWMQLLCLCLFLKKVTFSFYN